MHIHDSIQESMAVKQRLLEEPHTQAIHQMGGRLIEALKNGNKILVAGNGGSAADAQHFAAELIGNFSPLRTRALPAIAVTANSSVITAVGNDLHFDHVFSRKVEALGNKGDVFFGITTSGNSRNIVRAMESAKARELITMGLLGKDGGAVKSLCDHALIVPSDNTQRIQECHILVLHILCELIDHAFRNES